MFFNCDSGALDLCMTGLFFLRGPISDCSPNSNVSLVAVLINRHNQERAWYQLLILCPVGTRIARYPPSRVLFLQTPSNRLEF